MSIEDMTISHRGSRWFRWLPRIVFIVLILAPILEVPYFNLVIMESGPKYWDFGRYNYSIFYLIIAGVAWVAPIIGGIIAIIATPIILIISALAVWMAGLSPWEEQFLNFELLLLILGGILSIIWGILKRRGRRGSQ